MNNKILFLIAFFITNICSNVIADDLTVSVTNIIVDNGITNDGEIEIELGSGILSVLVEGTSPCGEILPFNATTTINIAATCPGEYCFTITKNPDTPFECCIHFCVNVSFCFNYTGTIGGNIGFEGILCLKEGKNDPGGTERSINNDDIFLESSIEQVNADKISLSSSVTTTMNGQSYLQIESLIHDQSINIIEKIVGGNNIPKLVNDQNEFQSDAPVVMKFDYQGNLIWVDLREDANLGLDKDIISNENLDTYKLMVLDVFPNPFDKVINVNIIAPESNELQVNLVNTLGELILSRSINVSKGDNTVSLETNNISLLDGMYILMIRDKSGFEFSKKLITLNR